MSFHESSGNIEIIMKDGRTWLIGRATRDDGSLNDILFDLDNIIGNKDGRLTWGGQGFTQSASEIRFSIEGGSKAPILRAVLSDAQGGKQESSLNLGERLKNENGDLVFE